MICLVLVSLWSYHGKFLFYWFLFYVVQYLRRFRLKGHVVTGILKA